jgi:hypothetical protein
VSESKEFSVVIFDLERERMSDLCVSVCVCFGCDLFLYFDFAKMKLYVCVVIFEK